MKSQSIHILLVRSRKFGDRNGIWNKLQRPVARHVSIALIGLKAQHKTRGYFWHRKVFTSVTSIVVYRLPDWCVTKSFGPDIVCANCCGDCFAMKEKVARVDSDLATTQNGVNDAEFNYLNVITWNDVNLCISRKLYKLTSSLQSTCTRPLSSSLVNSTTSPWIAARCNWMSDGDSFCREEKKKNSEWNIELELDVKREKKKKCISSRRQRLKDEHFCNFF